MGASVEHNNLYRAAVSQLFSIFRSFAQIVAGLQLSGPSAGVARVQAVRSIAA
jgi:hypothetical protein